MADEIRNGDSKVRVVPGGNGMIPSTSNRGSGAARLSRTV